MEGVAATRNIPTVAYLTACLHCHEHSRLCWPALRNRSAYTHCVTKRVPPILFVSGVLMQAKGLKSPCSEDFSEKLCFSDFARIQEQALPQNLCKKLTKSWIEYLNPVFASWNNGSSIFVVQEILLFYATNVVLFLFSEKVYFFT